MIHLCIMFACVLMYVLGLFPPGKYMFVEYSRNIPLRFFQYIQRKIPNEIPGNIPK